MYITVTACTYPTMVTNLYKRSGQLSRQRHHPDSEGSRVRVPVWLHIFLTLLHNHKMQVKFLSGHTPPNFCRVMAHFGLRQYPDDNCYMSQYLLLHRPGPFNKYNTKSLISGVDSLAQWLWYWAVIQVQFPQGPSKSEQMFLLTLVSLGSSGMSFNGTYLQILIKYLKLCIYFVTFFKTLLRKRSYREQANAVNIVCIYPNNQRSEQNVLLVKS